MIVGIRNFSVFKLLGYLLCSGGKIHSSARNGECLML